MKLLIDKIYSNDDFEVLKFLIEVLNPNENISHLTLLYLNKNDFFERLVKISSKHLIIPSLYASILRKGIVKKFPKDLINYFKEIYEINSNRNKLLLKQINFLGEIFSVNKLDYVFLKGSALLISQPYDVISERMIGDIDILVSPENLNAASDILKKNGFNEVSPKENLFSDGVFLPRHLNRFIHKKYISAVEIHQLAIDKDYVKLIPTDNILKSKLEKNNNFFIPSKIYMLKHIILNWQYNDYGYRNNMLSLRSVYDTLHFKPKKLNEFVSYEHKSIKHFYALISIFLNNYPQNFRFSKFLFCLQHKSVLFNFLYVNFIRLYHLIIVITKRLILLIFNNRYRDNILRNFNLIYKKIIDFLKM